MNIAIVKHYQMRMKTKVVFELEAIPSSFQQTFHDILLRCRSFSQSPADYVAFEFIQNNKSIAIPVKRISDFDTLDLLKHWPLKFNSSDKIVAVAYICSFALFI